MGARSWREERAATRTSSASPATALPKRSSPTQALEARSRAQAVSTAVASRSCPALGVWGTSAPLIGHASSAVWTQCGHIALRQRQLTRGRKLSSRLPEAEQRFNGKRQTTCSWRRTRRERNVMWSVYKLPAKPPNPHRDKYARHPATRRGPKSRWATILRSSVLWRSRRACCMGEIQEAIWGLSCEA